MNKQELKEHTTQEETMLKPEKLTIEECRIEREKVLAKMEPYGLALYRRLEQANDLHFEEEDLLRRYDMLTFHIGDEDNE